MILLDMLKTTTKEGKVLPITDNTPIHSAAKTLNKLGDNFEVM